MFRHWLALPNISNVIYIPQKRSQTLQVKPNHKPSQSLHLHKMFIFSSCRPRGAQQQIWPAAAHHANAVSTNGRLAAKTLNIALSDLFNALLIRKETNTGTCGRPRFVGDSRSSIWERPGSHSLSCSSNFLVGQLHPCPFLDQVVCLLFCQGSRCLTTAISLQIFHWRSQGARENEGKRCKSTDGTHTHRPLSLLQPWMQWNTLGAPVRTHVGAAHAAQQWREVQACVAFCSHHRCWRRRWEASAPGRCRVPSIPPCPPGPCNSPGSSKDMRGRKRWGTWESLGSGQGKVAREDKTPWLWSHPISVQLRHPEPALVSSLLGPEVRRCKFAWKQDLCLSPSCTQDPVLPLAPTQQYWPSPNPSKDWEASYRSRRLSQPSQHSHWLGSWSGSGTITPRSQSKSVTERWNIWFQVM